MTSSTVAGAVRYYAPPAAPPAGRSRRVAALLAVLGVHLLVAGLIAAAVVRPELAPPVRALAVRLLETPPPVAPKAEPPKPPPKAAPQRAQTPPVLAAASSTPAAPAFVVAPQPEPVAAPVAQAPAPLPVIAARFDADYLQNPKPVYPPLSRRLGEEGKVVLRVRVSPQGLPLAVDIKQSSGFPRLDEAARSAVERWRFVPARQGEQAIEASVLVPLHFTLSN